MSISRNIRAINKEIEEVCRKAGRSPEEITLITVTKYVTLEKVNEVIDTGEMHIAENRLEGLEEKQAGIDNPDVKWHFIGNLQSRKVKNIVNKIDYFHALDRLSIAKEINKRANKQMSCFVQVNVSGEKSKNGIKPDEVNEFIESLAAFSNIKVIGLMTMAPHVDDELILRKTFQKLRLLRDEIAMKNYDHAPCKGLSMGMSNDYKIAIEEGATHLRVGSRIVRTEG